MSRTSQVISVLLFFSCATVMAGTVVEIKSDNQTSTILTNGKQARLNTGAQDYVIIDYKSNTVKIVNSNERKVIHFAADNMPKTGSAPKIQTVIKNLGAGGSVAGFATQRFSYKVNGSDCGIIYGSKQAFQHPHIKALFSAIQTMMQQQQEMLGGFAGMLDDCTLGDIEMSKHTATIGVPMRTVKHGVVDFEVKSIRFDVALAANAFAIPPSYKTVTIKDEMQKMQQQIPQDLQRQMQQMQQSGQIPPELMEKMRNLEQQMEQYQRPGY